MLEFGQMLQEGRYRVGEMLGQGGMATVYRAADTRLGDRPVAIKQFDAEALDTGDRAWAVEAFRQEAEVLARLRHRGIARVTDFFEEEGYWYLVMEYVAGETLEEALRRSGTFAESQVLTWAGQLADVLDHLHQQNPPIVFRDLKPSNVIVQTDGSLKLIDFGIARFFKQGQQADTVNLGTPGYAAPEQYGHMQSNPRSDVYSMAVVLHQLLTNFNPSSAPHQLPAVQQLRPDVSDRTARALQQALELVPEGRFRTVMDFAAALDAPLPGPTTPTHRLPVEDRSSFAPIAAWLRALPRPIYVVVALVIIGAPLIYVALGGGPEKPDSSPAGDRAPTNNNVEIADASSLISTPTATTTMTQMPTASATPMATATATSTATPPPTDTSTPTPSPTSSATPSLTSTPPPTPCAISVYGTYQSRHSQAVDRLGCAASAPRTIWMAQETFQYGRMFWREDTDRIYVLYNNGVWSIYQDTWRETDPEFTCGTPTSPPTPKRGFGKVWCTYSAVRSGLGDATTAEWGDTNVAQDFAGGSIFTHSSRTYVLFTADGRWE